jgi:hypothetical protein
MNLSYRIMGVAARLTLALGAVCLLLGAYLATQTMNFTQNAQKTTGTVVRYYENQEEGRAAYRPVIRFTTTNGDIISTTEQLPSSTKRFAIGARVPVQYPFGQPMKARIATFTDFWLGATIAGVVGLLALVAGVFIRRAVRAELARGRA